MLQELEGGGRIIQPQNFPCGTVKDVETALHLIKNQDYEGLSLLYGDVAGVLSSTIRGAIVPQEGYDFMVADYAAIEARVLVWLAGDTETCQNFRMGLTSILKWQKYTIPKKYLKYSGRLVSK